MAEWIGYLTAAKTVIDTLKGIRDLLPKGETSHKIGQQIGEAERALELSRAELAKGLGYHLCKCTFPPQIMLWKETEKTNVCPACGKKYPPKVQVSTLKTPGPWGRR